MAAVCVACIELGAQNAVAPAVTDAWSNAEQLLVAERRSDVALALLQERPERTARAARLASLAHRLRFEQIAAETADPAVKHFWQGMFAFEKGQYRRAFYHYRRTLALAPDFPGAHTAVSEIYHRTGHPDWAEIEVQREKNLPAQGELQKALAHLQAAQNAEFDLSSFAGSWELLEQQGRAAMAAERWGEAAELLRRAVKLHGDGVLTARLLAQALVRLAKWQEAAPLLERAEMRGELALAYAELGRREPAERIAERGPFGLTVDGAMLGARVWIELGKPARALPGLQAMAAKDADGRLHEMLAKTYQALHQANPAGLAWRRSAELRKADLAIAETEITAP